MGAIADGSTIEQAIAVPATTGKPNGDAWPEAVGATCPACGEQAWLAGQGRHRCRKCGLWLFFIETKGAVATTCLKTS